MDYKTYTIGSICDVKTGKLDANASSVDGQYPFFTCSREPLRIDTFSYDAECVLVAGNGDLNVKYYKGKFDAYQRTYIITLKKGVTGISVPYLYSFFSLYVNTLRAKSIGGVIKYIKLGDITEARVNIPSLPEQERIVTELGLLSNILNQQSELLAEQDVLAESLFLDMFGDILNAPPKVTLKDIASYVIGLTYKPDDVSDAGTIVLRSSNIQDNQLDFNDIVRVSVPIDKKKYVEEGDILMCARNGSARLVGKVARIQNLHEEMSFGAFMTVIKSKYNDFLFHFFLSRYFRSQLATAQTATINQITSKMLDGIKLNVPTEEKQRLFAEKVKDVEQQKARIKRAIAETQKLYDYTMDKYFG